MKTGPVKAWASFCGGWQSSDDECSYGQGGEILEGIEPKFIMVREQSPLQQRFQQVNCTNHGKRRLLTKVA